LSQTPFTVNAYFRRTQIKMNDFLSLPWKIVAILFVVTLSACAEKDQPRPIAQEVTADVQPDLPPADASTEVSATRFATFNVALNRKTEGALAKELASGQSEPAAQLAEIIQRVRPDILLLNEFDYDAEGQGIESFQANFLAKSQNGERPIEFKYVFSGPVNTGVDSGLDLNGDGKTGTAEDAFGYGAFPGQYGMVVLSHYPIQSDSVRTFQKFLWADMPNALWPIDPATKKPYYNDAIKRQFRLSSKSHWDVPILVGQQVIHFLVSHPTPPVFDGPEDRNGCRNHDEIRFWSDYVTGKFDYHVDDAGKSGSLPPNTNFVIAGDQNADPVDGDSVRRAAIQLTENPAINNHPAPKSDGGTYYAREQAGANAKQAGDPALDTGDFNDVSVGNMRIDYCLPSKTLNVISSGVFWPTPDQPGGDLVDASDHRMVWVDVGW
jgi:hypothetical protein